jgi:hypothetical protein
MPRVFVPQVPHKRIGNELVEAYDLTPAREFGEVVVLTGPSAKPWTNSVLDEMSEKLLEVTEEDYILMVGSPVMCAIAVAYMSEELNGKVNFLQWDGLRKRYFPITISLWET